MDPAAPHPPLTPEERARLALWQRWTIGTFVISMVLFVAVIFWPLPPRGHFWVWLLAVALLVISAAVQFARPCPRCGANIGTRARLKLPATCRRCGVALRE